MKVLIHDYAGHPFQVQLSRSLARRGHHVTHVYADSLQTPRGSLAPRTDDPASLDIRALGISGGLAKHSFVKRRFQEVAYGRQIADLTTSVNPDWVISGNTPSEAQDILARRCARKRIRFGAWVQDFYGVAVEKLLRRRLPVVGELVGKYYQYLDARVLKHSDQIILITDDFRELTSRMGIEHERIAVIENWAPLEELPLRERKNPWSHEKELDDRFVFLYSGTLGMKHNPEMLLELARKYAPIEPIRVVVISEGVGADWLREKRSKLHLTNLELLPYQPFELLPDVMASADVLVAILEPDAGVFSVPSKVLTYLCAGKPLLGAMPEENLAARLIAKTGAGRVVPPDSVDRFLEAAEALYTDESGRRTAGRRARRYAEQTFNIEQITDRFEAFLA